MSKATGLTVNVVKALEAVRYVARHKNTETAQGYTGQIQYDFLMPRVEHARTFDDLSIPTLVTTAEVEDKLLEMLMDTGNATATDRAAAAKNIRDQRFRAWRDQKSKRSPVPEPSPDSPASDEGDEELVEDGVDATPRMRFSVRRQRRMTPPKEEQLNGFRFVPTGNSRDTPSAFQVAPRQENTRASCDTMQAVASTKFQLGATTKIPELPLDYVDSEYGIDEDAEQQQQQQRQDKYGDILLENADRPEEHHGHTPRFKSSVMLKRTREFIEKDGRTTSP
ncbi:uncharacterized protein DSM5745_00802 [Aspergillus mulundensis]|uniref:Uncharacterized protein n=1 Tax=Aspergillus mulundensis TaxID=1810919 RepID=A0A3D8T4L5_9EURO|nr:hypothetical protein DSM5745_00802 [Aspergillus mulundensis]RDW93480.1 hypothetical protein DSM5745_00802 [Aspergillus mulundensis]